MSARPPFIHAVAMGASLTALLSCSTATPPQSRTFPTPDDAARALIEAAKSPGTDKLFEVFGPGGQDLVDTSDPAAARRRREVFNIAAAEQWRLAPDGDDARTLEIGHEQWPFPIPITQEANGWRFDLDKGREEVLSRRIGRNELRVLRIARTYVAAQRIYATRAHDGKPAGLYARTFRSDAGRQNGLYWPAKRGEKRSPLGDLVAQASSDGRAATAKPSPFHGYYFRILTAQGADAPGGARDYVRNGELAGGFALVAWPAEYDATGIMTFAVNQDGKVVEKDLGRDTDAVARAMTLYNPDASWTATQ